MSDVDGTTLPLQGEVKAPCQAPRGGHHKPAIDFYRNNLSRTVPPASRHRLSLHHKYSSTIASISQNGKIR